MRWQTLVLRLLGGVEVIASLPALCHQLLAVRHHDYSEVLSCVATMVVGHLGVDQVDDCLAFWR